MHKNTAFIGGIIIIGAIGGGLYYANKKGWLDRFKASGSGSSNPDGTTSQNNISMAWYSIPQTSNNMLYASVIFSYTGPKITSGFDIQLTIYDGNDPFKVNERHFGLDPNVDKPEGWAYPVQSGHTYYLRVKAFDSTGKQIGPELTGNVTIP